MGHVVAKKPVTGLLAPIKPILWSLILKLITTESVYRVFLPLAGGERRLLFTSSPAYGGTITSHRISRRRAHRVTRIMPSDRLAHIKNNPSTKYIKV